MYKPFPIVSRGLWFDGQHKYLTVTGFSLNHSFTLEFFLKAYCSQDHIGSLFANYRSPYTNVGGSLYSFKIVKGLLALSEEPSGQSLSSPCEPEERVLEQEFWSHVALTVNFN